MLPKTILVFFFFLLTVININVSAQLNQNEPIVELITNQGTIKLILYQDVAPKAVENFLTHIKNGYYDGLTFHRVIKNVIIQGGDPTASGYGGQSIWGEPFEDEVSPYLLWDKPGLLGMANAGPRTNGSQFFISMVELPKLNMKHTLFGEVIEGYDVVINMGNVPTDENDKPKEEQKIIKAIIVNR